MTKSEELESVLEVVRATLENCQRQNEKLIRGLRYYAESDWRTVVLADRGERAREILSEIGLKERVA